MLKIEPVGISVIIPVKNEQENISQLLLELIRVLSSDDEIIFIDDGSTDEPMVEILKHANSALQVRTRVIRLRKNFGKSTALSIGLGYVSEDKDYVLTMDSDLQDDPKYIPLFKETLDKNNLDCVVGWRRNRLELSKKMPSKIYNFLIRKFSGMQIHDMNCGMKMFKKKVLMKHQVYGEMHRYIPLIIESFGFKVGEVRIEQRQRLHGKSKYGISRMYTGFIDLMTVLFLYKYGQSPGYVFSALGMFSLVISAVFFSLATYRWFAHGMVSVSVTIATFFFVTGFLCIITGLLSEQINSMAQVNKDKSRFIKKVEDI